MKIAHDVLERFTELPPTSRELRELLDDVGIEVKRVHDEHGPIVYTVELLANRGDHHCYEGIAREISGRTGLPVHRPAVLHLTEGSGYPVKIESDKVLRYTATELRRDGPSIPLSAEVLRPLDAAGIHSISPPVDATNLANHEFGQPTHVFDRSKIDGPIVIRTSTAGERAWLLFEDEPREIPEGLLVIADATKILAIAGVIGCEDSKATAACTHIVIESACFDPVTVRLAARKLDVLTDSSARFERGSDPELAIVGAGRVAYLLQQAGWSPPQATTIAGDWVDPQRIIRLSVDATNAFLAIELLPEEIADILTRYGFQCQLEGPTVAVRVPSWRVWDVDTVADLYEEIAKSVGYNNTPTFLPPVEMGSRPTPVEQRHAQVDEVMVGAGFYEVISDGFYGRQIRELLNLSEEHPLWAHVETTNANDRAYSLLKNNCVAQAVLAIADNLNMRTENVKIYEWTRTFHPRAGADGGRTLSPAEERPVMWAICTGSDTPGTWAKNARPADVLFLKGVVEELAIELGLELLVDVPSDEDPLISLLHPGRRASITLDGECVGVIGEIHPNILKNAKIKRARPCYLEISADALLAPGSRPAYREPSSTHTIERNLAFALPPKVEADAIAAWMHASGPDWLERVRIVDLFDFTEDSTAMRAITYALTFENPDGRSADQVNQALLELTRAVQEQFGGQGVHQR